MIIADFGNAQITEDLIDRFAVMTESNSTVMGIMACDQNVTVEASHLGDSKDADAAEGAGGNGQDLAFCNISIQTAFCFALQITVENSIAAQGIVFHTVVITVLIAFNTIVMTVLMALNTVVTMVL